MNKLLSKKETAELLSVSIRTLDRMRSSGELPATKVRGAVRFNPAVIEKYIAKNTKAGA